MAGVTRSLDAANSYAGNYPSYDSAGTSKFIPQLFAGKMLKNFYMSTCLSEIASTDYEGEIKSGGDKVLIRRTPVIAVSDYAVGQTLTYEVPTVANTELNIDQAKSWSFRIDDIDAVASDLNLMNEFASDAGERLKIAIDTDVLGYIYNLADSNNIGATAGAISHSVSMGVAGTPITITKDNAIQKIVEVNQVLDEQNIPSEGRFLVLPAWFVALLKQSDLKAANITGDATAVLRSGVIGMIDRTKIIQSNAVKTVTDTVTCYHCMGGTKEAITFANQLIKTETLQIPDSFGTYMRGLSVYGRAVVQPKALVDLYVRK